MNDVTGIAEIETSGGFALSQNNPNPFNGTTDANLNVIVPGDVAIEISDVNGRIVEKQNFASLQTGNHRFRIQISAAGIYFMTARQRGQSSTIKMINNGSGSDNSVEYVGIENKKQSLFSAKGGVKGATNNPFSFGDQMEYISYATINGEEIESEHLIQVQNDYDPIVLTFATALLIDGQPCPGAATLTDVDGNVYNTVQIGQQCWMKENLRTTKYADGTDISLGSGSSSTTAYRYCPNNDTNNVPTHGYLYNWPAVMHGATSSETNPSGVQGDCPNGWHIPSDSEWTQLTDYVISQSQYVCGRNSSSIAKALASTIGWASSSYTCTVGNNPSTNNATGFSAVPAGLYNDDFDYFGFNAYFWSATSNVSPDAYGRGLYSSNGGVGTTDNSLYYGYSVRCIKD